MHPHIQLYDYYPPRALVKTNDVDHADWNYRFLLGYIQRQRFKLIRSLLHGQHFPRLLEIGYGSGVFMPTLAQHCTELYGIDPHPHQEQVRKMLLQFGVRAALASGSAMAMPYDNGSFDAVVAVSALEFIPDLDIACQEILRVLSPGGVFVMVTPGHSSVVDWGLRLLTKKNPDQDFGNRRQNILPSVFNHFEVEERRIART